MYTSFWGFLFSDSTPYDFNARNAYGKLSPPQSASGPHFSDPNLRAETVFRGLDFSSSMAFLGNNDLLVLEKNEGTVRRIVNGNMLEDPLLKVNVSSTGERGMLGIAVTRNNNSINGPPFIFLYYTEVVPKEDPVKQKLGDSAARNKLYRYELVDHKLVRPKLILDLPPTKESIHNGGAIAIGIDGYVYLAVGDMYGANPQESLEYSGRSGILRVNEDGHAVKTKENEFLIGNSSPLNKYYAYGIRNSFGIDFDPITGRLWDTENGPGFGDEINLVGPGFNSGWSVIQGFWNEGDQNATVLHPDDKLALEEKTYYSNPEFASIPSLGLTGLSFLDSPRYGIRYQNDLLVGDFHYGHLYHFELNRERTGLNLPDAIRDGIAYDLNDLRFNILGRGFGGITDIEVGPDGFLYVLSLYQGGSKCPGSSSEGKNCINYDRELQGTIFRMVPREGY
jgi:glucose/arabinose dehydrogenase